MKNQCIKWAERCDFTEYYLIISDTGFTSEERHFPHWVEWKSSPDEEYKSYKSYEWRFVIHIGRIPECETITIENIFQKEYERIQNIQDSSMFWKPYRIELKPSDTCTGAEKHLAELLEDSRDKEALQWLNFRNATVRDLEQQHVQADRRFNQEQTDAAERTDTAEHVATDAAKQTDLESMRKELNGITGRGYKGRRRLLMKDKYRLTVSQIWEYENDDSWEELTAGERAAYTKAITQAIDRAREKAKPKKRLSKK